MRRTVFPKYALATVTGGDNQAQTPEMTSEIVRKIINKIRIATDEKLLGNNLQKALKYAFAAKKLCDENSQETGVEPFRVLAAYRLALLLLRKEPPLKTKDLHEIDKLLEFVCTYAYMGPWPYLYRMPVLALLSKKRGQRALYHSRLKDALSVAHKILKTHFDDDSFVYSANQEKREYDYPLLIQSHLFNALELACFFSELPYSALESSIHAILYRTPSSTNTQSVSLGFSLIDQSIDPVSASWQMLSLSPRTFSYSFPRPIIERQAELDFLAAKERGSKMLLLVSDRDGALDLPRCRMTCDRRDIDVKERFKDMRVHDVVNLLTPRDEDDAFIERPESCNTANSAGRTRGALRHVKPESKRRTLARRRKRLAELFGNSISFTNGVPTLTDGARIVVTLRAE
jgi:hypothetical protein